MTSPDDYQVSHETHEHSNDRAARYGRLLALVAAVADDAAQTPDRSMRLTGVQALLYAHGIHGGYVDDGGQPVPPPHDAGCLRCAGWRP